MGSRHGVLVVDDDEEFRHSFCAWLSTAGYQPHEAHSTAQALTLALEARVRVAIVNIWLADGDGLSILPALRKCRPELPVILLTSRSTMETAIEALRRGALDYVLKPVDPAAMQRLLERALAPGSESVRSSTPIVTETSQLIGDHPVMSRLRERIAATHATRGTVLITGEAGTGKELVARAVHAATPAAPFVPVNCAALPAELIESELFGYRSGAFTSARGESSGLLGAADGGTLFLDEITEMPQAAQAKLLRVVQERSYRPVGAQIEIPVDVRFVASTNRDLDRARSDGKLREDLYWRLRVVELAVPPLRERSSDVGALAHHFVDRLNRRYAPRVSGLSAPALRALGEHHWPGNVRELEHMIESAWTLCRGALLDVDDLGLAPRRPAPAPSVPRELPLPAAALSTLKETERRAIHHVLRHVNGNKTEAARILGISRKQLYVKLATLGMTDPDPESGPG